MSGKCIIIGCEMLRNEIEYAYQKCDCTWPIQWIPRSYHNTPERLKDYLQDVIDQCQEYEKIIFTFGCCGGGTDGLCSPKADMIFAHFEDCIHMLLFSRQENKSLAQKGVIYLTEGWTHDEQSIIQQYEYSRKKYGTKMCASIMKMMFGNFHELSVIDTGAYEVEKVIEYAKKAAPLANLCQTCCKGTTEILEDLFSGNLTGQCMEYKAGRIVKKEDFI